VLAQGVTVALVSFAILAVTLFSALFRNQVAEKIAIGSWTLGSLNLNYSYAPLPDVATTQRTMASGLVVQEPIIGDQCWSNYPLCTYSMGDDIAFLDNSIENGFITAR
jgi:hypothetical protein